MQKLSLSAEINHNIGKRAYQIAHPYSSLSPEQKQRRREAQKRCLAKKKLDLEFKEKERLRSAENYQKRKVYHSARKYISRARKKYMQENIELFYSPEPVPISNAQLSMEELFGESWST